MTEKFTSWPRGKLPPHFLRTEPDEVRKYGVEWNDARDIVAEFERRVAEFAGSRYAVAVDCCTNGVFLSLKWLQHSGQLTVGSVVTIPARTYVSIGQQIVHAGNRVAFDDREWSGRYLLEGTPIWDAATRWKREMYTGGLHVCSFQLKKQIPIGRGGMVLTDDPEAARWIKKAGYDGRDLSVPQWEDDYEIMGYHMYMTPEDAARGIILMSQVSENCDDCGGSDNYSDLRLKTIFKPYL